LIRVRLTAFVNEAAGLLARVAQANRRNLVAIGAAIQSKARSLIRIGKGPSQPGQPPVSQTGRLPASIQFELDGNDTVLVGPTSLRANPSGGVPTVGTVPSNLEGGGQRTVIEVWRRGRWQIAKGPTGNLPTRQRIVTVEPRPFMGPALRDIGPRLPSFWADSVT
jgi:hypothetical protein